MFVRSGEAGRLRPHVVIAHSDATYVSNVERAFRRHGWAVAPVADGPLARQLAARLPANLVILEAGLPHESGWLTCAKLSISSARCPVVLVTGAEDSRDEEFADFAGAARLVTREAGTAPLLEEAGIAGPVKQAV
jgi:DNA-binding response OmpR family regulator